MIPTSLTWAMVALMCFLRAHAIDLNVGSADSLKAAASITAANMMSFYATDNEDGIPGKLTGTWWEGGAMYNMLIQYWHFTNDTTYNNATIQGLLWQAGSDHNYMPTNWSSYIGNDDQVFWGLAAMTAAEVNFPTFPNSPSWLELAQGVFNTQTERWDTSSCGGGLRWQLYPFQAGWTFKNSVSNGGLYELSARLAVYTGNQSYADWATKVWEWSSSSILVNTTNWTIEDGAATTSNCTESVILQWTYNYGVYMMGAAYMYNFTKGDPTWSTILDNLLVTTINTFFPTAYGSVVMSEVACERPMTCNRDQDCFKGILAHYLAFITYMVPNTTATIMPLLLGSATAAAKQCSGGSNGTLCGRRWWQPTWDGTSSLEEELSVLGVFSAALVNMTVASGPLSASTGGKSQSNPGAGTTTNNGFGDTLPAITTADRAGAWILTILMIGASASLVVFLCR